MNIKDSKVLITGAANGLGRTILDRIISNGGSVIALDRDKSKLDKLSGHPRISCIECDLLDLERLETSIGEVMLEHKRIDALINNAAVLHSEPIYSIFNENKRHRLETWNDTVALNLTVPFLLSAHVIGHMINNRVRGVILNITSVSSKGNEGQTAYSATKGGLESMTKTWAKELGIYGIRSVAVAPGFLDIESTKKAISERNKKDIEKKIPLKKFGTTEDIANTVIFVLENDYINGTIISVDGGLVL